jgi:hypothetical protein
MRKCNENLIKALEYVKELIRIADNGDFYRDDDGCGMVYGVIRDSAYKIKQLTETEIENHKRKGKWDNEYLKV